MRMYHLGICENKTKTFQKENEKLESIVDIQKTFKEKYSENLNAFYGKNQTYNLKFIYNFCDAFICDYTEQREMTELRNSGIDFEDLKSYCYNLSSLYFRDYELGDKNGEAAKLEVSPLMEEFIHYMKQRIDADINGENISAKYEDYSRPKILMVSGHDSTVASLEIFLIHALGKDLSFYEYPDFASQAALEVTTNDDNKSDKNYDDYFVCYYLNDDIKFNLTVQEFLDKISPNIWSQNEISEYCKVNQSYTEVYIRVNEDKILMNKILRGFVLLLFLIL